MGCKAENMTIEILKLISFGELEEKLRQVPLMKKDAQGKEILIYEHANSQLRTFSTQEVNPTSFYLLGRNLAFQRELREHLLKIYDIDVLNLSGALELKNGNEIWTLTPPIIESTQRTVQYQPQAGEISHPGNCRISIPIINDGLHRVYLAWQTTGTFKGIHISGALEEYPFYAHPNEWEKIKVLDELPKTKEEKKLYSREDCYALYRNFGILGCGAPRHTS